MADKEQTYDARAVANEMIDMAWSKGNVLYAIQVIKLVYLCHAWMLGLHGRPLIKQEVEAWQYGPVIADLYHALKRYRGVPISGKIQKGWMMGEYSDEFDDAAANIITQVYDKYGHLTGASLSAYTHEDGSPWHTMAAGVVNGYRNVVIPRPLIQAYYAGFVNE